MRKIIFCTFIIVLFFSYHKRLARADYVPVKIDLVFEKIALCESANDPHQKNPYSTASGRFQFLWGTWNYYGRKFWGEEFFQKNIFNYEDNTDLAWYVYKTYGTHDWDASKSCWN